MGQLCLDNAYEVRIDESDSKWFEPINQINGVDIQDRIGVGLWLFDYIREHFKPQE